MEVYHKGILVKPWQNGAPSDAVQDSGERMGQATRARRARVAVDPRRVTILTAEEVSRLGFQPLPPRR